MDGGCVEADGGENGGFLAARRLVVFGYRGEPDWNWTGLSNQGNRPAWHPFNTSIIPLGKF